MENYSVFIWMPVEQRQEISAGQENILMKEILSAGGGTR